MLLNLIGDIGGHIDVRGFYRHTSIGEFNGLDIGKGLRLFQESGLMANKVKMTQA
ncbi:MAG TPA: hypothetical protein G4N93_00320 [Dehalococcoidia bacterium]|nr:hypothetical protein [Dehalococcoidia bacterium]